RDGVSWTGSTAWGHGEVVGGGCPLVAGFPDAAAMDDLAFHHHAAYAAIVEQLAVGQAPGALNDLVPVAAAVDRGQQCPDRRGRTWVDRDVERAHGPLAIFVIGVAVVADQ